jgi:soluble lytic murein transglycosylase
VNWKWLLLGLLALGLALLVGVAWWWRAGRVERSQDRRIQAASRRYQVDPALVKAVVWRESGFNPLARGPKGEAGLMQLRDAAAQEWAEAERVFPLPKEHLFDPVTNVMAGTYYLGRLLQRYTRTDDPVPYALADYNAGRSHVLRWAQGAASTNSARFLTGITFPATRHYILSILERQQRYKGTLAR